MSFIAYDNVELDECLALLKHYSASFRLPVNCRNTKQIVDANILMTGISNIGKPKISGLKVDYIPYSDRREEKKVIEELLIELKNSGICGNDIVILSKYSINNPQNCLYQSPIARNIGTLKTMGQMWLAKKSEIRFSTISAFKGLEANVIIIFDMDGFLNQTTRLLNYVGISRACSKLYVLYNRECENERQDMIVNFYRRL